MAWNKYCILIKNIFKENKYKHDIIPSEFCPMGCLNPDKYCILPCFLFDTSHCTNLNYTKSQLLSAQKW